MTEQEKQVLIECMQDTANCAINTVYGSLALLFETISKHPELSLQEVLIAMSLALKELEKTRK